VAQLECFRTKTGENSVRNSLIVAALLACCLPARGEIPDDRKAEFQTNFNRGCVQSAIAKGCGGGGCPESVATKRCDCVGNVLAKSLTLAESYATAATFTDAIRAKMNEATAACDRQ
jgi:hypothetical protein